MTKPFPDPVFNTTSAMMEYVNSVTESWFFVLFLVASTIILFALIRLKGYRISNCLFVSFFLTFAMASLLWAAGIIAGKILLLFLLCTIGSGIYAIIDS